jgi:hypothetical protein
MSPWGLAASRFRERHDRSDGDACSDDGSSSDHDRTHPALLGRRDGYTCRLRCGDPSGMRRLGGSGTHRLLRRRLLNLRRLDLRRLRRFGLLALRFG